MTAACAAESPCVGRHAVTSTPELRRPARQPHTGVLASVNDHAGRGERSIRDPQRRSRRGSLSFRTTPAAGESSGQRRSHRLGNPAQRPAPREAAPRVGCSHLVNRPGHTVSEPRATVVNTPADAPSCAISAPPSEPLRATSRSARRDGSRSRPGMRAGSGSRSHAG